MAVGVGGYGGGGRKGRGVNTEQGRRERQRQVLSGCLNVLRWFEDLRELYLIVDDPGDGDGGLLGQDEEMDVEAMEVLKEPAGRRAFQSYARTYVALENMGRRRDLKVPVAALHAIREGLVCEEALKREIYLG